MADNSETKKTTVFIFAHDTRFDRPSSRVKFHKVILYGSNVIAFLHTDSQVGDMCQ